MSLKRPDAAADAPRWFTALNIFVVTVNGKPICRWKVLSAIIQAVFYFCFAWLTVPLYRRTLCAVKAARRGALFSQFDFAPQRADSRTCRLTFGWKVKVLKLLCAPFTWDGKHHCTAAARWRWGGKLFLETHKSDNKARLWFPQLKSVSPYLDISHLFVIFAHLKCLYHAYQSSAVTNVIKNIQISAFFQWKLISGINTDYQVLIPVFCSYCISFVISIIYQKDNLQR